LTPAGLRCADREAEHVGRAPRLPARRSIPGGRRFRIRGGAGRPENVRAADRRPSFLVNGRRGPVVRRHGGRTRQRRAVGASTKGGGEQGRGERRAQADGRSIPGLIGVGQTRFQARESYWRLAQIFRPLPHPIPWSDGIQGRMAREQLDASPRPMKFAGGDTHHRLGSGGDQPGSSPRSRASRSISFITS